MAASIASKETTNTVAADDVERSLSSPEDNNLQQLLYTSITIV
jgi:hypothetical protein